MEPSITDKKINEELMKLLALIGEDELIQRYKKIEEKVQNNEKLTELVEQIKAAQKDAVQFAHYDKPEAEKAAIQRADELTKEFDEHPLVVAYREQLMEANDLLQHVTDMIQYRINEELEKEG
ncbi:MULTISPECIES: RicAFT regulatory complex protein RicA family protein [unclassified Enterococcus]|uniref:RicAFT regulatory complex protein RicA family protein n=1 Tax=unclassified Enterococcus TaxID=2608891 RepID=UPI001CE02877|nr:MULTISPECIES: YlbF family regulator [unclassified Enterococcus]MCA5011957.1 YlbF family regulator [Enterococcus sp. S23]MCA5015208.1 YlbF family regulator [Enterococcus sp. S22(2020)]